MLGQVRRWVLVLGIMALSARVCFADAYDPPPTYYNAASGTGATLKTQLHTIIKGHTVIPYTSSSSTDCRRALQITDADPVQPGHMLSVYDRASIDLAAIVPDAQGIFGWDGGKTWSREHTWPQSRGVGSNGPDTSDLFLLRPALSATNGDRGNLNYGGAYGAQPFGTVTDAGQSYWYPGDADAGMIARQEFYLAVRYDGSEANTTDLEIGIGNPPNDTSTTEDPPPQLGNLTRMLDWNYAVPPDDFERHRNQIIYSDYQHNRDPFTDHPEWVWSVFVNQTNDSQIAINGATVGSDGSSTKNFDLGRVFAGAAVPAAQNVTLNKSGQNGTYYRVTAAGSATSTLSGPFNAFRTNQTDSKTFSVGLNTDTVAAGLRSGTVTVDNLDITTGGGNGHGANDANDTINVSLTVLDHAMPSFDGASAVNSLTYDFGDVTLGSADPTFNFSVFNFGTNRTYTASMDFDSVTPSGDASVLTTDLAASAGALAIGGGLSHAFMAMLDTAAAGTYSATYNLMLSDENIAGAQNKSLSLTLMGHVVAALLSGDYNGDGFVDAADYTVWRDTMGQGVTPHSGADGDGSGTVDAGDYQVWVDNFGQSSPGAGAGATSGASSAVPEPGGLFLISFGAALVLLSRRVR